MFMDRGETELAEEQVRNHPELIEKEEVKEETKSKRKK